MVSDDLWAQDARQELVVGDVLDHGHHDPPRLLEHLVRAPVRVEAGQRVGDGVVLPHQQRVQQRQPGLLVHPLVPRLEALLVRGAALGIVRGEGQQVLHGGAGVGGGVAGHAEPGAFPESPGLARVAAVHHAAVQEVGDGIQLLPVRVESRPPRQRSDELHTFLPVAALVEEFILLGDEYGVAAAVTEGGVARPALQEGVVVAAVLRGQRQVVVYELPPLHDGQRVLRVERLQSLVNNIGHLPGVGKGEPPEN